MASPQVTPNQDSLSPQDMSDLREIATRLPAGHPSQGKISTLLNSQPTEFERERTPDVKSGGALNAIKDDLSGFGKGGQNPYPGMGLEQKQDAYQQSAAADEKRKAAGYGSLYRHTVPFAESVGTNVSGMEDAAARGDVRGVLGHAALPTTMAVAPLAAEGISKVPMRKPVGAALRFVGDAVDPEVTGIVSPRAAHLQRVAGRIGKAMQEKPSISAPITESASESPEAAANAPQTPEWLTHVQENVDRIARPSNVFPRRTLSLDKAPFTEAPASPLGPPKQLGEGVLEGEYLPQPEPPAKPGPRLLKRAPFTEAPASGAPVPETKLLREPTTVPRIGGRAEKLEDAGIKEADQGDLDRHERSALGEERRNFADRNSMDKPKGLRIAESKAQAIRDEAEQRAQAVLDAAQNKPVRLTDTKPLGGKAKPKPIGPATDDEDLSDTLQRSIDQVKARKK